MAEPFSTNELLLRSDRIAFGRTPPEVPERTEQTLILPDITGSKLFFGLSTLVSTSGLTGTLEAIYPQNASFTFDNLNKKFGINLSTPLYAIDISSTTGIRLQGGTLVANASGLVSVPTAALFSTLPTYVFAPGSIPPEAIASTGSAILGISVPTSALYGTVPTALFAPSSIPLLALQSSGVIVASSFVGDGYYLSNIPLANINGTVTGDFFRPNSIPLSTLASTGQIWIRNPTGAVYAPVMSTLQIQISSFTANNASTIQLAAGSLLASSIQADKFTSITFNTSNISTIGIQTNTLQALQSVSTGLFYGDGRFIRNLTASNLSGTIPGSNFGNQVIPINAINPYGNWSWEYGIITLKQNAPLISYGDITASSFHGGFFIGDGSRLYNINSISSISLTSTVVGLGTAGYVSTSQLLSSVAGLARLMSTSSTEASLQSTVEGLGTLGYVSTSQLVSSVAGLTKLMSTSSSEIILQSTVEGLGTIGYISSLQFLSTARSYADEFRTSTLVASNIQNSVLSTQAIYASSIVANFTTLEHQLNADTVWANTVSASNLLFVDDGGLAIQNLTGTSPYMIYLGTLNQDIVAQNVINGVLNWQTVVSKLTGYYNFNNGAGSDILTLTRGGAVGISCNAPTYTLDVNGDIHAAGVLSTQAIYTSSIVGNYARLDNDLIANTVRANNVTASTTMTILDGGLVIQNSSGTIPYTIYLESHGRDIQTQYLVNDVDQWDVRVLQTNGNYVFNNFLGSDILTLTRSGQVGILCNAPSYTLDVNGDIHASGVFYGNGSGLFNVNYISSLSLRSTVEGLGTAGYVSTASLYSSINGALSTFSSAIGPGGTNMLTIMSTVDGLGTLGYASTLTVNSSITGYLSSFSTAIGPGGTNMLTITSTVEGLGTAGYVSSLTLISTTAGLEKYISSFIDIAELTSTVVSTVAGIGLQSNITSTIQGLGTYGYVSTASLYSSINGSLSTFSTAIGPGGTNMLTIISTVEGLGTYGYVSTASLYSSINGSLSTFSTAIGPGGTNMVSIMSTVQGLGTAGYVSTQSLTSSITGLGTVGYISSFGLRSTVAGLGTAGYTSTTMVGAFFSSLSTSYRNNFNTVTSIISSLTVSSLTFGTGDGFLAMPDIRPTAMSTLVTQTSSLQAFNLQIGATSTTTAIQFFGLLGNFNNTVIAERSTGTGTQELVVFKGSSISDQIRFQTTGIFEVETGVSSRLWPNTTQNATPSFVIDLNSNVGIQTATPATTLDVAGTGRFQILSTLQLNVSSITGIPAIQTGGLVSTVAGLGTAGYISTASLTSTVQGLAIIGYVSTASLVSTVAGIGTAGYISTASLTSTVGGLGSTGYISSLNRVSFISAQQILASSIYATLAGPTTVVLYEF